MFVTPSTSIPDSSTRLEAVRDIFVAEAISAPRLFADLAKLERYIAESYKTRSFIELIQNADDAEAKRFGIHKIGSSIIVGNDGHVFTPRDVEALCRSGSSQKMRGGNSIGYRGIGFKSVVNIAQRVTVISGDYVFGFDRDRIKRQIPGLTEVPLIRIPVIPSPEEASAIRARVSEIQKTFAYTTLFIFESGENRLVADELAAIDRHAFLFLRSVQMVEVALHDQHRSISINRSMLTDREIISVCEDSASDEWLLLRHPIAQSDVVAFKLHDQEIVSADSAISVIHSFLPTTEASGALLKINGDYSTDPSRKTVDLDETSLRSFGRAVDLIANAVKAGIEGEGVPGLFRPLTMESPPGRFKRLLYEALSRQFQQAQVIINRRKLLLADIRLRPTWLNHEDYEVLCVEKGCHLTKSVTSRFPELPAFLERFGVPRLSVTEALEFVNGARLSIIGAAQILAKTINQYRYDLTLERIAFLQKISLFPVKGTLMKATAVESFEQTDQPFRNYLISEVAANDLEPFLRKLGMSLGTVVPESKPSSNLEVSAKLSLPINSPTPLAASLTRWRSAEKNAEEYFRAISGVLSVSDVTLANMGYDLEVVYQNGKRLLVEVKSVKNFAEPIKITNNEYASAHKYGDEYCLAIVINGDQFEMKIVQDPIRALVFHKQIERWSWLCESYAEQLISPRECAVASLGAE